MRTKYNKRRFRTAIMIILILFCMSIGYSYLLTTLNIEGTSNIKANTWDVHWENISVKSGSVTGDQVPIAAHILTDTTQVEYSVILKNPGDYYEFTVDAKNAGSLDAMVSITDTKFYESNGVTQISLPSYLEYEFMYNDGTSIENNQLLAANSSKKLKMKLKFKDNLEGSELPTTDKTIVIRQNAIYVQADESATIPENDNFETHSWTQIINNLLAGNEEYYEVGDTKEVDMGSLGIHTLRLVNTSTPDECNNTGFSQTACGFVVEFADVITNKVYGGTDWQDSTIRAFVNNDIYNALPSDLKNIIIDTYIVTIVDMPTNDRYLYTTDKLFLRGMGEATSTSLYDFDRCLDYYDNNLSLRKIIKNAPYWERGTEDYGTPSGFVVDTDLYYGSPYYMRILDQTSGVSPSFRIGR